MATAKTTLNELAGSCDQFSKYTEGLQPITRNVQQISEKSLQLAQSPAVHDPNKAQTLLRAGGVDLGKMNKEISTFMETEAAVSSAPPQLFSNDVEGFLALERDKTILDAITETRNETHQKWQQQYQAVLLGEWESTKRSLLSHMGVQFPLVVSPPTSNGTSSSFPPLTYTSPPDVSFKSNTALPPFYNPTTSTLPRTLFDEHTAQYARIVTHMVQKGQHPSPLPTPHLTNYVQEFESYTKPLHDKGAELNDVWKLLSAMVGKATKVPGASSVPGTAYRGQDALRAAYEREDPGLQAQLTEGALSFLQEQYANLIEQENARQPAMAKHGGVPGADPTIRAYLNLLPKMDGKANPSALVDGVQPWAYIYYMLRCGWMEHALQFVERNRDKFGSFALFFSDYVTNKRRLSVQQWENCCKEFNSNVRPQEKDSFKLTVWNLVSRCEVNEFRAFRDVIKSTQDFVWYKLMLVSFDPVPEKLKAQELRLQQVQQQLFALGPGHFTHSGSTPFVYLFVVLAVQLFEQGLAFLYSSTPYQVEAVHMAIVLDHYCLLRVPTLSYPEFPVELLTINNNGKTTLNFPHIIRDYAARLVFTNPIEALSYCALLERDSLALVVCVSDLVFLSGELDAFLGSIFSANKQEALVEKIFPKHLREIRILVAQKCQAQGKIEEAVRLFDLAGETETALQLVIRQLSKMLAAHVSDRQRIVSVARDMQKRLNPAQFNGLQTSSLLVAFDQLLNLDVFFSLVAASKFSEALNHMATLHLIPFDASQIQPCTAIFHRLHETVKRLFPEVLSTTMQLLTHQHTQLVQYSQGTVGGGYYDSSRAERDHAIQAAAKAIVTFSGSIQYLFPKDLTAQLLSSELIIRS